MAFENTWKITNISDQKDKNDNYYLTIEYVDLKDADQKVRKQNIFSYSEEDRAMQQVFKEAHKEGLLCEVKVDKVSNRWKPVEVKLMKDAIEELQTGKDETPKYEPPKETPKTISEPSGQEIGMTVKEIGDMIRAGSLKTVFDVDTANNLLVWYRTRILGTTRVAHDGSKFPKFKKETE